MRSKNPQISVVIPAFNEEKYLPACLASLSGQSFRNFEVIVVDNNSTDRTSEIAKSFRVRLVKEKIQGMIPARERGFEAAKSEIIARTDADTVVPQSWLSQIYDTFKNHPEIVALGGGLEFPQLGIFDKPLQWIADFFYIKPTRFLRGHYVIYGPNNSVRKSAWRQIRVHRDDKKVHEDIDLSCHLSNVGRILYCPEIKVSYSMRRWRHRPVYTAIEYFVRYIRTLLIHHHTYIHYHRKYKQVVSRVKKQKAAVLLKKLENRLQ